jgi:hypothetical protein
MADEIETNPTQGPQSERDTKFYLPGGFNADTMRHELETNAASGTQDRNSFYDQVRTLAYFADANNSGGLTKQELTDFRDASDNKGIIDFSNFVLKNFDTIGTLAQNQWNTKDPQLNSRLKAYLGDTVPDDQISRADLDVLPQVKSDYEPLHMRWLREDAQHKDGLGVFFGLNQNTVRFNKLHAEYLKRHDAIKAMFE